MITTSNYIVKAVVDGEVFIFQYDEAGDAWETLEQFWHEDYPEVLIDKGGGLFPIDVIAMDGGKAIRKYEFTFDFAVFDHFFDKGWSASSTEPGQRYTLDQFAKDIERKPDDKPDVKHATGIIALWSDWCMDYDDENLWLDYMVKHPKGHCNRQHLQEKWDCCYEKYGSKAAMNMFWRELDNDNREILTEYIITKYHH
jgi:hypothetical protein